MEKNIDQKVIAEKYNITHSTVSKITKKYEKDNFMSHLGRNGRHLRINFVISEIIGKELKKNLKTSLRKLVHVVFNLMRTKVSNLTIKRWLNEILSLCFPSNFKTKIRIYRRYEALKKNNMYARRQNIKNNF